MIENRERAKILRHLRAQRRNQRRKLYDVAREYDTPDAKAYDLRVMLHRAAVATLNDAIHDIEQGAHAR
jgi:hypothetical protein